MPSLFDLPFEEPEPEPVLPAEPAGVRDAPAAAAPARKERVVYSVSDLTARIRGVLERDLPELHVEGEISNCRQWNTGHIYFTLKDANAQIRAVLFRSAARQLRFRMEDGQHVIVRGRVEVYEAKGEYQIVCDRVEPVGAGALQIAFEQLKRRLEAEGLFDAARKRPLPTLPRTIGVVTSMDGAALRDIITVLRSRFADARVVLRPTRVQGDGAAFEVARAIRAIAMVRGIDVVIVGRGGGSIEDLWAFNEEVVARAIAACRVPVISAVGHETDYTIADFVADVRAATPSAAASIVAARRNDVCTTVHRLHDRMHALMRARVNAARGRVHAASGRTALAGWPGRVAMRARHVFELRHALHGAMRGRIDRAARESMALQRRLEARDLRRRAGLARTRAVAARGRLDVLLQQRRHRLEARLGAAAGRLEMLSPLAVLGRGYAVCWDVGGRQAVRRADSLQAGDRIHVTLAAGRVDATVTGTHPDSRGRTGGEDGP
jgi:exodeoxyribonuclease VII large subunit